MNPDPATASLPAAPVADQFTAARIAEILGVNVRRIRGAVASLAPDGHCFVSGSFTKTYLVSSLPAGIQEELARLASVRGFECVERMLQRDEARWQPPIPVSQIHPEEVTRAQKKAAALAHYCAEWSKGTRPATELQSAALAAFKGALNYAVTVETLVATLQTTIRRDGGRSEFDRWELYLPECPRRAVVPGGKGVDGAFPQIDAALVGRNHASPTPEDRSWMWTAACDELRTQIDLGAAFRRTRRQVLNYLFAKAPWMARTKASLATGFDSKWRRYEAGERFIKDRRPEKSGNFSAPQLSAEDEQKLIARALHGGVSRAWRESQRSGDLSPQVLQRYIANPASKSYAPAKIRRLVTSKVAMLDDVHHGPRQAKLNGAYITRDWSNVLPGDWQQADDCTLPVYYWDLGPDGRAHAIRGQFLLMIDVATNRALGFALHGEPNYNARVIRGLMLDVHDSVGLPRKGYHFERGIWQRSRLITGSAYEIDGEETEKGMRDHNVIFMHAKLPRAKVIERILGLLQTRMEDQPGYCGRDEKTEKFEAVQRKLILARAGKISFESFLLHRDEWAARLQTICEEYNSERQDGNLKGLSPREAWESKYDQTAPAVRLDGPARFILANHRRPYQVTSNGIRIQLGKEVHWFQSEELGALRQQVVQVYFNPEDMSSVWVRRAGRGNERPLVVARAPSIPAMDATPEQLGEAHARCAEFNRPARTLYRKIAVHFPKNGPSPFRANIVPPSTLQEIAEISQQQEEIRAAESARVTNTRKLKQYERRFGTISGSAVSDQRKLRAMQLLDKATRANAD